LFHSVLASHKDKYGDIHHLVGTANHNIGLVHLFAKHYTQALTYFHEAVTVRRASLGLDHPDVSASMMKIGMIQLLQRDAEQARDTFLKMLRLIRKTLGYGHIQVARVLNNLAVAHYDLGSYWDAFRTFQQAHEIQRKLLLLSHTENTSILNQTRIIELALSNTLNNLGFMYGRQKKFLDACRILEEAVKMRPLNEPVLDIVGSVEENLRYVRKRLDEEMENSIEPPAAEDAKSPGILRFMDRLPWAACTAPQHLL
jgi:tetratricopeptide (TPR) repeat protein